MLKWYKNCDMLFAKTNAGENMKAKTVGLVKSLAAQKSSGKIVHMENDDWYKISNYDSIPPFFMTITSSSDVWNFIWSAGGLSAGRKDSNFAVFPYYTADKIEDMRHCTGAYTAVKIIDGEETYLWEPFSEVSPWKVERNLYKNSAGSHIIFAEKNVELDLTFRQEWTSSAKYGLVRIAKIMNGGNANRSLSILDGARNIMSACSGSDLQNQNSILLDAYKKTDLDEKTNLAIFGLSSVICDKAEPSEALWANTCWFSTKEKVYLDFETEKEFARGNALEQTKVLKGKRASCYIVKDLTLSANAEEVWYQVFNTHQEIVEIRELSSLLNDRKVLTVDLEKDIAESEKLLNEYIAGADGIQDTADSITCMHHKANVMFNIMRGGVFAENDLIHTEDFVDFVSVRNKAKVEDAKKLCSAETVTYGELGKEVSLKGDEQLYRLYLEYLPLSFSRRHGDPSRPWNKFSINLKDTLGNPILNYEGNWRDIFQNWEALAMSYPCYTTGMIAKFLNAITADGFNPYRITRNGLDWEVPNPNDPWSNIGYWNDHQVIYLCKLLELQEQINPSEMQGLLNKAVFSTSNVPYHIKDYDEILKNPRNTIFFDTELNEKIVKETKIFGTDAKLVGKDGNPYLVTLTSKLLQLILAKLANFVPCGGIWLNTQRPEWNDANNALAGYGLSMVTLYYLRRMMAFMKKLYEDSNETEFAVASCVAELFENLVAIYKNADKEKLQENKERFEFVKKCGTAFANERKNVYSNGSVLTVSKNISKEEIISALDLFISHAEYSIKLNKKENGLYHSYNTLGISKDELSVEYLQEMLEGQVAVLSSGMLSSSEVLDLCKALKASGIYEKRQNSYMLYPNKELPLFENKNGLKKADAEKSAFLKEQLARGYTRPDATSIVYNDSLDSSLCHFNPDFRNAQVMCEVLKAYESKIDADEKNVILALYEKTFNHKVFTGRSGTFYAYEGLGSIYWHMVSKLLLAVQENFFVAQKANDANAASLAKLYYDVRSGLGFNKTPELYGAFPTDPYSHTPSMQGAKQPGMTGQVKEEVITRWGELGMQILDGKLIINPTLLKKSEFKADGTLSFTRFGVKFTYNLSKANECKITVDGKPEANELSNEENANLFARNGKIQNVKVSVPESILLA